MRLSHASVGSAGVLLVAAALCSGCSLEAAMATCASCGEVRAVTPRMAQRQIRLPTSLDAYAPAMPAAGDAMVFHVRVRMDRGGSRDFLLPRAEVRVGDRVEVRGGALVVRGAAGMRWS